MGEVPWQIASCLVAVFTAVGNGCVIFLIICRPRLHKTPYWFALSLAVSDFCFAIVSIARIFHCEPDERHFCHEAFLFYARWLFISASTANLCCLAADHLISVQCSLRYAELMTTKRAVLLIAAAWAISLIFTSSALTVELAIDEGRYPEYRGFGWLYVAVMVIIPTLFLLVAVTRIVYTARKLSLETVAITAQLNFNRPQGSSVVAAPNNRGAKIRSSMIIVCAVVSFFVLCRSVATYRIVCSVLIASCTSPEALVRVSDFMFTVNSALNPVACSFLSSDFKAELRRLYCHPQVSLQ